MVKLPTNLVKLINYYKSPLIISASSKGINISELDTGLFINSISTKRSPIVTDWVCCLALTRDNKYLVAGLLTGVIQIWDMTSNKLVNSIANHTDVINSIVITSDDKYIIFGSNDLTIRISCLFGSGSIFLDENIKNIRRLVISADNKYIICGSGRKAIIWEFDTKKQIDFINMSSLVNVVAITSDNKYVVVGGNNGRIQIWEMGSDEINEIILYSRKITSIVTTSDNKYMVTGSACKKIIIVELSTYRVMNVLAGHLNSITSITSDNKYIISASNKGEIKIWDYETKKNIRTLTGNNEIESVIVTYAVPYPE